MVRIVRWAVGEQRKILSVKWSRLWSILEQDVERRFGVNGFCVNSERRVESFVDLIVFEDRSSVLLKLNIYVMRNNKPLESPLFWQWALFAPFGCVGRTLSSRLSKPEQQSVAMKA